jgi:hypothetical protein
LAIQRPIARVPIGVFILKNRAISPLQRWFIESALEVANSLAKESAFAMSVHGPNAIDEMCQQCRLAGELRT